MTKDGKDTSLKTEVQYY